MNTYKYYLRINGKIIIHLEDYKKYGPITDFLGLNLFTSDFNSIAEIAEELKRLGVLKKNVEVESMDIVYQSNNKYYISTDKPLLREEYLYYNENTVKDFFKKNKHNYVEMGRIIDRSRNKLDRIVQWISEEDIGKAKYVEFVRRRLTNIDRLQVLCISLSKGQNEFLDEYNSRLKEFIEGEIFYKRGDKLTVNYHGLLDMTRTIILALEAYTNFERPIIDIKPKVKSITPNQSEDTVDPDEYMFLENDDFASLYPYQSDALEGQLEDLTEKKKRL